jgi:DNA-binding transcriptional ArsR family regulator
MKMKLTRNETRILKEIAKGSSKRIGDIANSLTISNASFSRTLKSLKKKGLIESEKRGVSKHMFFSETKHSTLLKTLLTELAHVKFEDLLPGSSLEILYSLSKSPLNRREIILHTGLSQKTVQTKLKTLREFGIVFSERGFNRLNERFSLLKDFLLEFRRYLNLKVAQEFAKDATILWQRDKEFLIKTSEPKESKSFFLTSITAFHKYGVQLFLPEYYYYFYSQRKKKLTVEDVILHALLLDPTDTRVIMSALLLLKKQKVNRDYIIEESDRYQLNTTVRNLVDYIHTKGKAKPEHFPTWKEYEAKAKEYGP